jgi:integrase
MARAIRSAPLETRTARLKLKVSKKPVFVRIGDGISVGYRRNDGPGTWVLRVANGKGGSWTRAIGRADDHQDADGLHVLDYWQAQGKAREEAEASTSPATPGAKVRPVTVGDAIDRYLAYLKAEKKTEADARQRLDKHVRPQLGDERVRDLTLVKLTEWRDGLVRRDEEDPDVERRSKDTANRLLNYLKAALSRLILDHTTGITDDRAWRHLKPFQRVGRPREVHLDADQMNRLRNAAQGAFRDLVTAALLTGCRSGELKAMRVMDYHRPTETVRVRDGKTGARDVGLTAEAVAFFDSITAGKHPDALMFARDDGSPWGKDDHIRPMAAAAKTASLPGETVFYSLRHTHASQAIMAGMPPQLLAENMGTSIAMLENHYAKFFAASRKRHIEAAGLKLGLTFDDKVVSLRAM